MTWHPTALTRVEDHYPNSVTAQARYREALAEFTKYYDSGELDQELKNAQIVFLRGFFSDYMWGYMMKPLRHLRRLGLNVSMAPIDSGASATQNARILRDSLPADRPYYLLCHSKGGIDLMTALRLYPDAPCFRNLRGVALSQTASGPSAVMDELAGVIGPQVDGPWHRFKNAFMNLAIRLCGQSSAAVELTTPGTAAAKPGLLAAKFPCPVISVASWSIESSSWTDSYHKRLCRHRPGVAHDGQFFLEDQLWEGKATQLILGGIDHAQPGMGGLGFDPGRYWQTLLQMLAARTYKG